ncbi:MAG: hypothetical protein MJ168_05890 [Clostridia bacterium]|nr:hypothetical protein [Clostridia bacterium]
MKDYNQIASELLERRDEFVTEQRRKRRNTIKAGTSVICVVAVAIGVGLWKKNDIKKPEVQGGAVTQIYTEIVEPQTKGEDNTKVDSPTKGENGTTVTEKTEKKKIDGTDTTEEISYLVKKIITNYPTSGDACYVAPRNGMQFSSREVEAALKDAKERNQKVTLLVSIDIFKDSDKVDDATEEYNRLSLLGYHFYTIPVWEYEGEDARKVYRQEIVTLLTSDMIENFSINPEYGYFIDFLTNGDNSPLDFNYAKPIEF